MNLYEKEPTVTPVIEEMLSNGERNHLMEIRFDCRVTAASFGCRRISKGGFLTPDRYGPPQWFRLDFKLTLESIKDCNEEQLGRAIKNAFAQLQDTIDKYEKS